MSKPLVFRIPAAWSTFYLVGTVGSDSVLLMGPRRSSWCTRTGGKHLFLDFSELLKPSTERLSHEMATDVVLDKLLKPLEEIAATSVGCQAGVRAYHIDVGCASSGSILRFLGSRLGDRLEAPLPKARKKGGGQGGGQRLRERQLSGPRREGRRVFSATCVC